MKRREDTPGFKPEPSQLVIFGASGDLTRRKLIPALYRLQERGLLPEEFTICGFSRTEMSREAFLQSVRESVSPPSQEGWERFSDRLFYFSGDYNDPVSYRALFDHLKGAGNLLFYLATPPSIYHRVIEILRDSLFSGKKNKKGWSRIIIEKPFGRDFSSAVELNRVAGEAFLESQIFRIDHYLGKETVQNILAFRFANAIFEPIWNSRYIDHVQITVSESIGVEGRGAYYEEAGALRDMVQNHLLQLMALVAMEPPVSLEADAIRDERQKVWKAVRPIAPREAGLYSVRAQYGPGKGPESGKGSPGYREEANVDPHSLVETYVAVLFLIDNWRWGSVPFFLRTGKHLVKRTSEIAIQFKRVPHPLFTRASDKTQEPNLLLLRIQPDEGITLQFEAKKEGPGIQLATRTLDFSFGPSHEKGTDPAYERLILDALRGDQTLFTREDGVEAGWSLIDPIIEGWKESGASRIPEYSAGSWGPEESERFIEKWGAKWRKP